MNIIFYKEWIKTRWYLLLMFVVTLGFAGYSMMRINRVVELKGVEHIWEIMISKDVIFIDLLQYIPVLQVSCWLWYSLCPKCTINV